MKNVVPSLFAAIAVFLWGMISWMALGWHQATWASFSDDAPIAEAVKNSAASGTGMYVLPGIKKPDGTHADRDTWKQAFEKGPFMMALVRPGLIPKSMLVRALGSLVIQFVGVMVLAWILEHCPKQTYWGRVGVCAAAGFFAGVVGWLPAWNWWDFPFTYVLVGAIDLLMGGIVAGLVLAKFIRPQISPHHQF
jgi:hypothetical protein